MLTNPVPEPAAPPGTSRPSVLPSRMRDFHDLMRYRIMDVLLVASPYDAFLLEEAGQLSERVLGEFRNLDLHYGPGLTTVATGAEALALARDPGRFGLVISALHLADMTGAELARQVRDAGHGPPVVLLAFDNTELNDFMTRNDLSAVERTFLWQGDARILLAIVKSVEDRRNVAHDTRATGVQVILLIEDNVQYYSSFLPAIYAELLHHSQRLLSEGRNLSEKIMRMRARPKILLCGTFEEAWEAFTLYQEDILGIVSDVEFPRGGTWSAEAGLAFVRLVKERWPDVPAILQSSRPENAPLAQAAGAAFLLKGSSLLLSDLRSFLLTDFGFGDFVFRLPDGQEVGRASDLRALEEQLRTIGADSLAYHARHNHFSKWLKARTEFDLAHDLRPWKVSDFPDPEALRRNLLDSIATYRHEQARSVVADFDRDTFDGSGDFFRIGGGSLGGKARGLAFVRLLLSESRIGRDLDGVAVTVPTSAVVGTDVFDAFLDDNDLREAAIAAESDEEVLALFDAARFPEETLADLRVLLEHVRHPLAVRSSSLLEDSQYQPFTGVYSTVMLANNEARDEDRLTRLVAAVKRVYASTFSRGAKAYIHATPYRLEEEKMAVILQKLVGASHGDPHRGRFYPHCAGVARSHNFYPHAPLTSADGIAAVALGLGRSVVEEGSCLRFCPRYPRHVVERSSTQDLLRHSQRMFWALDLGGGGGEVRLDLAAAEEDGTLASVASTYSPDNQTVYDGVARPGVRLVTFAPLLKHGLFPLAEVLDRLLEIGAWGMGGPVEIEFAVNLSAPADSLQELGFLQIRPLALSRETEELEMGTVEPERVLCRSDSVLGHGRLQDLYDVVIVDHEHVDRSRSRAIAQEVARLNASLLAERKPYVLIGVGRWGSLDPWLGIPVAWEQISGARVVVEAGFRDFRVTPSQGTHFFQNLTTFNVGYFTVNTDAGEGFLDWDFLAAQPALTEAPPVRHLRFERPLVVKMNGKTNQGVILKPSPPESPDPVREVLERG